MTNNRVTCSDLANFIIDLDDEDCPRHGLHLAAYQGDLAMMQAVMGQDDYDRADVDAALAQVGQRNLVAATPAFFPTQILVKIHCLCQSRVGG